MFPAVSLSDDQPLNAVVDLVLARGWRYDSKRRTFVSEDDVLFRPPKKLLAGCQLVYKVPSLAKRDKEELSEAERDLQRYMQLILPPKESTEEFIKETQLWPCIEAATHGPDVSLPN